MSFSVNHPDHLLAQGMIDGPEGQRSLFDAQMIQ
jgi:hypothetical protein